MNRKNGFIVVYTGKGKGKTTAALGLSLRAIGHGAKVFMVQFKKAESDKSGEIESIRKYLSSCFQVFQTGRKGPVASGEDIPEEEYSLAWDGFVKGKEALFSGEYELVIWDEINVVMDLGLLPVDKVVEALKERPPHVDIVLTGRSAPAEIIEIADLVSEVEDVKHPFHKGVKARTGMEF